LQPELDRANAAERSESRRDSGADIRPNIAPILWMAFSRFLLL
jgi:hypothetical protein